jgi:hypothetical protein
MNVQSFRTIKVLVLGLPLGSPRKKCHLDVAFTNRHKIYYREESGAIFPKVMSRVKLVFEIDFIKYVAPFAFNLH